MSKGVELVLITRQEIIVLPRTELTVTQGVPMAIKVKYSEPRLIIKMKTLVK
jgi:hypothetical protein